MKRAYRFLLKTNTVVFIFLFFGVTTIVSYFLQYLPLKGDMNLPDDLFESVGSPFLFFILSILMAPILETIFIQSMVIEFSTIALNKLKFRSRNIPVFLSAVIFGLNHIYNLHYIVATFIVGLVFGYGYTLTKNRKENPILIVSLVHGLYNLIPFTSSYFSGSGIFAVP